MDVEKALSGEMTRHKNALATIELAKGLGDWVSFVSDNKIFSEHIGLSELSKVLTEIAEVFGGYKLLRYYESSGALATSYEAGENEIILFLTPFGKALEKIGGGECRVEMVPREESVIVCGREG